MSYRNPQIIKQPVDGAGMSQAIIGAVSEIGEAFVTRKEDIAAEDLRIAERKALEEAQELKRYDLSLQAGAAEEKKYDEANEGFRDYTKGLWGSSLQTQYDLEKQLEADGATLEDKKRITEQIYKEKKKRQSMVAVVGGIGAAKEEVQKMGEDINFSSDAGKAFYEWSKEQGGWKLDNTKDGFVIVTNGKESYEVPNESFEKGTFKIGSPTPDIMSGNKVAIKTLNDEAKARAFGDDTANPQFLSDTAALAGTLTNKTMASVMSYAKTDKAAFEGILAKRLGLSDEDIKSVNNNLYSGDAVKVGMANAIIRNNIANRVSREVTNKTGLVRNKDGTFTPPAEKTKGGFQNSKTWTKGQWSSDLRTKTSEINSSEDVFTQLGIIPGTVNADGPGSLKTTISGDKNQKITLSRVNPKQTDVDGKPKPMGAGVTYDFSKKSNVMAYLKNTQSYPAGLQAEIAALADQIVKQYQ